MRSAIERGSRPGRPRWYSDKRCAPSVGKPRVSNGSRVPGGSSSFGAYGCIGCLIPLVLLLPRRRLRPSRSNQRPVLALGTPGANPFSDVPLSPLVLEKSFVQKNETHPCDRMQLKTAKWRIILRTQERSKTNWRKCSHFVQTARLREYALANACMCVTRARET